MCSDDFWTENVGEMSGLDLDGFDPSRLIRNGRFDPMVVLLLWCGRKAFLPMLWGGLLILVLSGQPLDEVDAQLDTLQEVIAAVFTPLVGVVVAIVFRVVVGFLSVIAAYPLTRLDRIDEAAYTTRFRYWQDRYFRTVAYNDLRRTWVVRDAAVERLGSTGRVISWCDPVLRWLGILMFAALTVALITQIAA